MLPLEVLLLMALTFHGVEDHYEYAACIIQHESGWDDEALGAHGEIGLAQIKPTTGRWFADMLGWSEGWQPETQLWDPSTNLYLLAWGLANGYDAHWTTAAGCKELLNDH